MGIRGAIVVSQGFADADEEGKALQDRLAQIARQKGIRILGPNTLGSANAFSGFTSSFMPLRRKRAPVAVICQSGTFFSGYPIFTGLLGKGIDLGNTCDLDFADALEYFGADDQIKVIFIHMEGIRDGRRFFEVARKVTSNKPIIALKTAKSAGGAHAASSHSGALVGDYEVFEAAFRQSGIISAQGTEEVLDYTKVLLHLPLMKGNRIGVITYTGAGGIILIDALQECGLELAKLSSNAAQTIKDLSPPWMPIQNPLDIWPALMKHGVEYVYGVALKETLKDPAVDGVLCIAMGPALPEQAFMDTAQVIRETAASFPEKPVTGWLYGANQPLFSKKLEKGGSVISLPTLPRAAKALAVLYQRQQFLQEPPSPPPCFPVREKEVGETLRKFRQKGDKKIEGEAAQIILEGYGIPVARSRLCKDQTEALRAAEQIGYPVVLKIQSPQIPHKTDVGGIALGLQGPAEIEEAYPSLMMGIKKRAPQAKVEGILVQEMIEGGFEVILGAKRDQQFGPTIIFGTGGIYTEIWRDIAYGIAPLSSQDAKRMIGETRCLHILRGARKDRSYDVDLLTECLLRLSQLMLEIEDIQEIDINPLKVFFQGGKAVDVRIYLQSISP
jgi:acetyltransferase